METSKILLDKKESAASLSISVRTLENLISLGELKTVRVGRRRLVKRTSLEEFARRDHATRANGQGRPE